jgi:RNA 3'-terminal phosphate cyclase (ATP)
MSRPRHLEEDASFRIEAAGAIDGGAALTLDGSHGEGGGQIVRTALSLAVALSRPVTIANVRAARPRPGLQPQHLTAVRALAAVSDAELDGAELHSTALRFAPRRLRGGTHRFEVGTAGAISLVFQALLLPLALAGERSRLTLTGGTHVTWSPPFHYLAGVFLPALAEMGIGAEATLRRWGWYPRGGGEMEATITPTSRPALRGFVAETRDPAVPIRGLSAVSHLPRSIAERQRGRAAERLAAAGVAAEIAIEDGVAAFGAGTLLFLHVPGRAGFSALGRRGLPAERVADAAVDPLLAYLASGAAVDEHLADQLVPFCALAGVESTFTCLAISPHLATVAWVVEQFLPIRVRLDAARPARVRIVPATAARRPV